MNPALEIRLGILQIPLRMRILAVLSLVAAGFCLSACNTFIGMARDVQVAGEGLEKVFRGEASGTPAEPPPPPPMQ